MSFLNCSHQSGSLHQLIQKPKEQGFKMLCKHILNKQCHKHNLTPTYAKIKIPFTSPAAIHTQYKITKLRLKYEIKFLYQKKGKLNKQLYNTPHVSERMGKKLASNRRVNQQFPKHRNARQMYYN